MNNAANWVDGVPLTNNQAQNQILNFGVEAGGSPDYTTVLNQGNNQDRQNVATIRFTTGANQGYTMNSSGNFYYSVWGRDLNNGFGEAIINQTNYVQTFNARIEANTANSSSIDQNIWDAGSGGLVFNGTISFNSSAKDIRITGTADTHFNAAVAFNNETGSSARVVAAGPGTVYINGTVGDATKLPSAVPQLVVTNGGTMLLGGPTGVDLIAGEQGSRQTGLTLDGGTFGFITTDNGNRIADFNRSLTLNAKSTIVFGADNSISSDHLVFRGTASTLNNNRLWIENWNGTPTVGGGNDRLVFASLDSFVAGQYIDSFRFRYNGQVYNGLAVASPNHPGFLEIVPGNLAPIPEPSTYMAGGGLLLLLLGHYWRLRRAKAQAEV